MLDEVYIDYFAQLIDVKRHQLEMEGFSKEEITKQLAEYREKLVKDYL